MVLYGNKRMDMQGIGRKRNEDYTRREKGPAVNWKAAEVQGRRQGIETSESGESFQVFNHRYVENISTEGISTEGE